MPIDDSRPGRLARATPAPIDAPSIPERGAGLEQAIDPQTLAEIRQQIEDIDEGREQPGMPWEAARVSMFAPPTPEELAEEESRRPARARR